MERIKDWGQLEGGKPIILDAAPGDLWVSAAGTPARQPWIYFRIGGDGDWRSSMRRKRQQVGMEAALVGRWNRAGVM
jgi:hypothetical protein